MLKVVQPWYEKGLKFKCTECGQCCTGAPGYIWMVEEEMEKISAYLDISVQEFIQRYTRRVKERLSLLEKPKTFDCIFLKDRKCQIYPVRPKQCRTFPWWPQLLKSEQEWLEASQFCEGINHPNAPLISLDTIQQHLAIQEGHLPHS
jgi:Fe-S-cluster containining protein